MTSNFDSGRNEVTFDSEGDQIAGLLFVPDGASGQEPRAAIVLNPPASGVKEQTIEVYARALAERGFVTLALDPRGFGDSEGRRQWQNPYRIAEDIRNSVTWIGTLDVVDDGRISVLGVCAGASYAAYAAAFDARVQVLAMVSPYLTSAADFVEDAGGSRGLRAQVLPGAAAARATFRETGQDLMTAVVPTTDEEAASARPIALGMMEYYLPDRPGDVPNWRNELSLISMETILSFSIYDFEHMFDGVPTVMAYGDQAVTAEGAQRFYDAISERADTAARDLLVVEGAGHFDLYWRPEYVEPAADRVADFVMANLPTSGSV